MDGIRLIADFRDLIGIKPQLCIALSKFCVQLACFVRFLSMVKFLTNAIVDIWCDFSKCVNRQSHCVM